VNLPPEFRTYQLCRLLSCTPLQLEDEPAARLEWFIRFRQAEVEVEKELSDG
jgi:hypothetical protein